MTNNAKDFNIMEFNKKHDPATIPALPMDRLTAKPQLELFTIPNSGTLTDSGCFSAPSAGLGEKKVDKEYTELTLTGLIRQQQEKDRQVALERHLLKYKEDRLHPPREI